MPFLAPRYIKEANIQNIDIRYLWDDWNIERALEPVNEEIYAQLQSISHRAVIAFTIASAEWIVYRYGKLIHDPALFQYLELAWSQIIDWRYSAKTWQDYTLKNKWTGPVKGPIDVALIRTHYTIQETVEEKVPELMAAWVTNLAEYVMTEPEPYIIWRKRAMQRLRKLYERVPGDQKGDVVPREVLDMDYDFKIDETEDLINRFLSSLNYEYNTFLSSPTRMLAHGFKGTPYFFEIEKDRQFRTIR